MLDDSSLAYNTLYFLILYAPSLAPEKHTICMYVCYIHRTMHDNYQKGYMLSALLDQSRGIYFHKYSMVHSIEYP